MKTQQLQLKSPVATSCGSVGLQFFAVAATGPSKTMKYKSSMEEIYLLKHLIVA
jgi:hypothetical protein